MMMLMVGSGATPRRTVRIPDDLWEAATARAADEGVTTSDLLRRLLIAHLGSDAPMPPPVEWRVTLDGREYLLRLAGDGGGAGR